MRAAWMACLLALSGLAGAQGAPSDQAAIRLSLAHLYAQEGYDALAEAEYRKVLDLEPGFNFARNVRKPIRLETFLETVRRALALS